VVFSESSFLFLFLPLTLICYFAFGKRARNWVLSIASLIFYALGEPGFIPILLISIAINYWVAIGLDDWRGQTRAKWLLAFGVVSDLALLVYFKYANFFVDGIAQIFSAFGLENRVELVGIALPLGISFFTFHKISYKVDVFRSSAKGRRDPLELALYILLFPQLVAGPIIRYHEIADQIAKRTVTIPGFAEGVRRFTIGLGYMFGFKFPENFNYPYISQSITEFWRRWHISLSRWFRDYLYIPLGGNRVAPHRIYINLMTVFFLCGLWHGASWNFVVWGVFHGAFLIIERLGFSNVLEKSPRILRHAYAVLVVMIGWVFFRADTYSPHGEIRRVLVFADSFSFLTSYLPFLSQHFQEAQWNWVRMNTRVNEELVRRYQPDLVILQRVERLVFQNENSYAQTARQNGGSP
jgi:alginate O-acetyltransferase complex protein AlgI